MYNRVVMEQILTSYRYWSDRCYKKLQKHNHWACNIYINSKFYSGEAQQWWVKVSVFRRKYIALF